MLEQARFLKISETARRLGVSERTTRRLIKSGRLPSTFFAGTYHVSEADLAEFVR